MVERKPQSQSEKFREAARELGADVPEEDFDRALKRVASPVDAKGTRHKPRSRADRKGSGKAKG